MIVTRTYVRKPEFCNLIGAFTFLRAAILWTKKSFECHQTLSREWEESGDGTRFSTDPRRNAGAHSIAIVHGLMNRRCAMNTVSVMDVNKALARLGFSTVKAEQCEVIKAFVEGNDVFSALPTGYGNSLCFAVLSVYYAENLYLRLRFSTCCVDERPKGKVFTERPCSVWH